jgi:3-oxoacyl-[acyl-carrier protein] reductase
MTTLVQPKNAIVPKRLVGKTALVTGGSRGIGRAIAMRLAEEGATVAISYNNSVNSANEVVEKITELGGKAFAFKGNASSEKETQQLVEQAVKELGQIDILVNNAGVWAAGSIDAISIEQYSEVFDVNVKGVIGTTIAALKNISNGGRIINISSGAADITLAGFSVYSASKAAVNALTRIWAQDLGKRGITVNAVSPGATESDMYHAALPGEMKETIADKTALGRVGQPKDIAAVVAFLASEDGGWVTGQAIVADGGINF